MNEFKYGSRVRWPYWRHFGYSSWVGEKDGVFYGLCPHKPGFARVLFYGNKNISRVPLRDLLSL